MWLHPKMRSLILKYAVIIHYNYPNDKQNSITLLDIIIPDKTNPMTLLDIYLTKQNPITTYFAGYIPDQTKPYNFAGYYT